MLSDVTESLSHTTSVKTIHKIITRTKLSALRLFIYAEPIFLDSVC